MVGNKRYYPTSAKQDGTTLNIRKTEKRKKTEKGKKIVLKIFFLKKGR